MSKLATAYLERQRKHWPKLAEAGLLPEPSDSVVANMVADFKHRHRTGKADVESVRPFLRICPRLGGAYSRYSCDNSSPNSALDQMVNALDRARRDECFVPWEYVFCDYSVTGLDPARQGYVSYKAVLAEEHHFVGTTYIDDFTRASRDEIEWWRLASLSKRLKKGLIGASDGFDLSNPNSEVLITMFGLVSRLHIKGLREKVARGMRGAARRRTNLGKVSLGFTRRIHRDPTGNIVRRPDGRPRHERCIDPTTREYRLLLYELYVKKGWSPNKIARHFNERKIDGSDRWSIPAVKKLLRSPTAIGVFIWNQTRREYDHESGKWVSVPNPRSEWEVTYDRSLAIVPLDLWRAARRKLAEARRKSPLTGRPKSRNQRSATTLFSGTLICGYCGNELTLSRSTGKYKQMSCLNGCRAANECRLSSSKSTRVIEDCLLNYLRDAFFSDVAIEAIVERANAVLVEEARKPLVDTAPMKAEVRQKEAAIAKLVRRVEATENPDLCDGYDKRIAELQREVNDLNTAIREASLREIRRCSPLDVDSARAYLADMRKILNQEIPVAAEAIRTLTGPIKIREEPVPGNEREVRWIATFSPDFSRLLRQVAK